MNGISFTASIFFPFALSLSKPVLSLVEGGERRSCCYSVRGTQAKRLTQLPHSSMLSRQEEADYDDGDRSEAHDRCGSGNQDGSGGRDRRVFCQPWHD